MPIAEAPVIHRHLVNVIRKGIGLATFLRTPDTLIHPVISFEAIQTLEAEGYTVDLDLLDVVLHMIRDSMSLKPPA